MASKKKPMVKNPDKSKDRIKELLAQALKALAIAAAKYAADRAREKEQHEARMSEIETAESKRLNEVKSTIKKLKKESK